LCACQGIGLFTLVKWLQRERAARNHAGLGGGNGQPTGLDRAAAMFLRRPGSARTVARVAPLDLDGGWASSKNPNKINDFCNFDTCKSQQVRITGMEFRGLIGAIHPEINHLQQISQYPLKFPKNLFTSASPSGITVVQ